MRTDLICENCSEQESTTLLFYEQYHSEIGKYSLINPAFLCDRCKELFLGRTVFLEHRPRLVPFEVLAQWDNRNHGILSKKGYEFNALASNTYFRKKIWRIKYIWKDGKN